MFILSENGSSSIGERAGKRIMSSLYNSGPNSALKLVEELRAKHPDEQPLAQWLSFFEAVLKNYKDGNENDVIVEAIKRNDAGWIQKCLDSVNAVKSQLLLPEEEIPRLEACSLALSYVLGAVKNGKHPLTEKKTPDGARNHA